MAGRPPERRDLQPGGTPARTEVVATGRTVTGLSGR